MRFLAVGELTIVGSRLVPAIVDSRSLQQAMSRLLTLQADDIVGAATEPDGDEEQNLPYAQTE